MASVNKVILVGNCGRDAELRYMPSGTPVANVSLATSIRRKDKNTGQYTEDVQWHRISFFDRLAEVAGEYVKKGRSIYVEGRLKYGKYTGQDGVERNTVDIVATELQLLGSPRDSQGSSGGYGDDSYSRQSTAGQQRPAPAVNQQMADGSGQGQPQNTGAAGGMDAAPFDDDDIPF